MRDGETDTEQQIGYGCICGFSTLDKKEFTSHVMFSAQRDGKGTHKSRGRIDMESGEVVVPPFAERSEEQRRQNRFRVPADGKEAAEGDPGSDGGKKGGGGGKGAVPQVQFTKELAGAQQVRVVPKIFTMDYTPIMRIAQEAAMKFFGWRQDMPFENFIDTCLYLFFLEKGITLCGYVVDDSLINKEDRNNGS